MTAMYFARFYEFAAVWTLYFPAEQRCRDSHLLLKALRLLFVTRQEHLRREMVFVGLAGRVVQGCLNCRMNPQGQIVRPLPDIDERRVLAIGQAP